MEDDSERRPIRPIITGFDTIFGAAPDEEIGEIEGESSVAVDAFLRRAHAILGDVGVVVETWMTSFPSCELSRCASSNLLLE